MSSIMTLPTLYIAFLFFIVSVFALGTTYSENTLPTTSTSKTTAPTAASLAATFTRITSHSFDAIATSPTSTLATNALSNHKQRDTGGCDNSYVENTQLATAFPETCTCYSQGGVAWRGWMINAITDTCNNVTIGT